MIYNIHYDICAIIIYAFTIYCILSKKDIRKNHNKVFFLIVLNGLISGIFDILSAKANAPGNNCPLLLKDIYNYGYLIVHNMVPLLFVLYVIMLSGLYLKKNKKFFSVLMIPFLVNIFVFVLNPVFSWVFYYDENDIYSHGIMMYWLYFSAFLYIGISIYYIEKCSRSIPKSKTAALFLFVFSGIFSIVFQFFYPMILIELFVQSLAFLGMLFTIENEDEIYNGMTGVYNRRAFLTENEMAIKGDIAYSVITIKFLNHTYYNATLGIVFMNSVMREIAHWIKKVTDNDNVYDCENGEFSLIMYRCTKEQVDEVADNLYKRFSKEWSHKDINIALSTQICIINVPRDVDTLEKLLTIVDTAYGKASHRVSMIYADQLSFLQRELEVEKAIRRGLAKKSFQVFYQPIWDRKTGTIHSAEALTRLYDDELGFIPPDEFIPISERNGTIVEIGAFVMEEVCRLFGEKKIQQFGIEFIELNLSVVQCMHRNLADRFEDILKKYGVSASCINLEITESAAANNPDMFIQTMNRLKSLGFTFSMDDYGTGYSNFSYMFDLDFDIIKLDKSILWHAEKNNNVNIILKNTIRMIKDMNLKVVVEGVETEAQKQYVSELECDYCQGYYFSRPVDQESFMQYCREYNQ